jgi:hypothetical protein
MKPYRRHNANGVMRGNGHIPRSTGLGHNTQVISPALRGLTADGREHDQGDGQRGQLLGGIA